MKKNTLKNFIYQASYQLLTILLPLITAPYLARVLGSECTGIYSYTHVLVTYFVLFAALGIESYGTRSIARAKDAEQEVLDSTFSSLFFMHVIVSAVSLVLYVSYVVFFLSKYKMIALLQLPWLIGALFDVNWFFFGMEEFKITVTRNFIIKILTIVLMFIFVHSSEDLWKYTLIMSVGTLVSQTVVWIVIPRYVSIVKVNYNSVFSHFKPLVVLFVAVIATSLYRMIDKLMIGNFCDMGVLGAYEYSDRIIKMAVSLITALGTVMLPKMTSLYNSENKELAEKYTELSVEFMFYMSFALACGLASISDVFMVVFLGDGYEASITLVKILAVSIPIMGWNNLVRTQILLPKSQDKVYTTAVWAGAIVDVILNYFLINLYGSIGAAISTVIAYAVVGVFQTFPIKEEVNILKYLRKSIFPLLVGMVMYLCVWLIGSFFGVGIGTLIIQIMIGAIIYISVSLAILYCKKNEIVVKYISKLSRKGN